MSLRLNRPTERPTAAIMQHKEIIHVEDSPEPLPSTLTLADHSAMAQPADPKDPEGFLRRCSGYNKKKNVRCSAIIGRNSHYSKNSHPTFLPTCYAHRDQHSFAGWCQFLQPDGDLCGRLFRWTPPYFELCAEHHGHPDTPCYFMKLPLELRLEIFRYLLPSRPVGSSTSLLHIDEEADQQQPWYHSTSPLRVGSATGRNSQNFMSASTLDRSTIRSVFVVPLTNLLLINRQIHDEVKDLFYSSVPFTVDIRKDGTFMCGRRLLEPRRADGSSHYVIGDVKKIKEKFIRTFNWAAVKNYNVDILVENWKDDHNRGSHFPWDEEVEIYDIRDYIGVVVTGILSKARNLCRLNVRLGFSKFLWTEQELQINVRTLVGPFERLRNVRQPRLLGIYEGTPQTNFMISLPIPSQAMNFLPPIGQTQVRPATPLCSVPQLPDKVSLLIGDHPNFAEYRSNWERWISSSCVSTLVVNPPIRAMFTELKEFYTRLAATVPEVTTRPGRRSFLHRARVAREQENVEAFRDLRNELIGYWEAYLEQEERKKDDMSRRLSKMLDADVYPPTWDEEHTCIASTLALTPPDSSSQSLIITHKRSWDSAASRSRQERSTISQRSSLLHAGTTSQTGDLKDIAPLNVQAPVIGEVSEEEGRKGQAVAVEQRRGFPGQQQQQFATHISTRPQHHNASPRYSPVAEAMASAGDRVSPSGSPKALQSPKDQQHMALNPQLHFQEAISHRTQMELQAHHDSTVQEKTCHHMQNQTQRAAAEAHGQPAISSTPYPHDTASPTVPMQQMQIRSRDVAVRNNIGQYESEASSSSMPGTVPTRIETLYQHQDGTPGFTANSSYGLNWNINIPSTEFAAQVREKPQMVDCRPMSGMCTTMMDPQNQHYFDNMPNGYTETSAHKRSACESDQQEDWEMTDGKRQRVDSGMGWSDAGSESEGKIKEQDGKMGSPDYQGEQHDSLYEHREWAVRASASWGANDRVPQYSSKGKERARPHEPEVVWVD